MQEICYFDRLVDPLAKGKHRCYLIGRKNQYNQYSPLGSFGVVLSCGVRARKALFYKDFAGSYFLSGSVKNRHFLKKWCSKWCSKKGTGMLSRKQ